MVATMMLQSFINSALWDKAWWDAVVYLHHPTNEEPPCLGLGFHHINVGKQIFQEWIEQFGRVDQHDELRIAIVEGPIPDRKDGYSVHISSNPQNTVRRAKEQQGLDIDADLVLTVGRIHRMYPEPGSPHLPLFKKDLAIHGRYFLLPVAMGGGSFDPQFEYSIGKREVLFRNVSELTENDVDNVILQPPPEPPKGPTIH
jgi:hypothetical protein